jgi:hypothetical protein
VHLVILLLLVVALALLVLGLVGGNSALAACSIAVSLIVVALIVRARQRRAERAQASVAEAERLARIEAEQDEATRLLAAATAEASRRAAAAPSERTAAAGPREQAAAAAPGSPAAPGSAVERGGKPADPPPRTLITDDALALFNLPGAGPAEFAVPAGLAVPAGRGSVAEAGEPPAAETVAPLDRHGQARVWVIDGRPRYHLAECRHLDGRAEPVSLNQAVQDGFSPCADCDPDNRITS